MKLLASYKQRIAWYHNNLNLSDYVLLWIVLFQGVFVALVFEKLIRY